MDFGGLQALRSDSDSSEEENSNQSFNGGKIEGAGRALEKSNQARKTDFELRKKVALIFVFFFMNCLFLM